jgi:S-DNA-T family DNA segregation ATPase FtsK/SpoIIIE
VGTLVGRRPDVLNLTRNLVIQIATHHRPDQVKIVGLFPHDEAPQWEWLRWLPHVWTDDRRRRFLACYQDAAHSLLTGLHDLLVARRGDQEVALPKYVFLLGDPTLAEEEPILPLLLREGPNLGAYLVLLSDPIDSFPKDRKTTVEVGPGISRLIPSDQPDPIEFTPDEVPVQLAQRFARVMAPIRSATPATPAGLEKVTLLDILGPQDVEELDVVSRWRESQPGKSLAAPVGQAAGAEPAMLDMHEKAHGPHGLVTGMEGAGKSELLRSLIASLAVHYHPHELVFLLIGPQLCNTFRELPHLVGDVSDLIDDRANHLLRSLENELERRTEAFSSAGVDRIDTYLEKVRSGRFPDPIPHLVILVDEDVGLAAERPYIVRDLIRLADDGRLLGFHLILTVHEPAELIAEGLGGILSFSFSPPIGRSEGIEDPLEEPDEAVLTQPGRMTLRTVESQIYESLQVAWGSAPYSAGGFVARDPHEILEVALDGSRHPLRLSTRPMRIEPAATQLEAVVAHIAAVAERESIKPLTDLSLFTPP